MDFVLYFTVEGEGRKEWCPYRSVTWRDLRAKGKHIHRRIHGLGGNTAKSQSQALLIPGIIQN